MKGTWTRKQWMSGLEEFISAFSTSTQEAIAFDNIIDICVDVAIHCRQYFTTENMIAVTTALYDCFQNVSHMAPYKSKATISKLAEFYALPISSISICYSKLQKNRSTINTINSINFSNNSNDSCPSSP